MLTLKYLKHVCFLDPTVTLAAPALPLWRAKLPWNVMGTDEYYNIYTHQAKLSKCFEKMDYLRPGQTCDICIIPILKWRGDKCSRSEGRWGQSWGGTLASQRPKALCAPMAEGSVQLTCCFLKEPTLHRKVLESFDMFKGWVVTEKIEFSP